MNQSALTFGKRKRYRFTAGGSLQQWQASAGAAVYAVTYKPDAVDRPKAHAVVYFGETTDLTKQSIVIQQQLQKWWDEHGGADGELFIFYHEMPNSSQHERVNVQHQLVMEYDPRGNN